MISKENEGQPKKKYLLELSHRGLVGPSGRFSRMVASIFAQLDYLQKFVQTKSDKKLCYKVLDRYALQLAVSCDLHQKSNRKKANTIIIIFSTIIYKSRLETK